MLPNQTALPVSRSANFFVAAILLFVSMVFASLSFASVSFRRKPPRRRRRNTAECRRTSTVCL